MKAILAITFAVIHWVGQQAAAQAPAPAKPRPNIIFILADDFGIDGVSAYGADKHKTPNIDALAASGLRFQTAYAAPLCGPSRCLLMTGRYAFRTGGLTNPSWRAGGPGAKSADEVPMARVLKQAGYATGQAGKWRQVGELPGDWGFDEFITDNTAGGWYWENQYNKNGKIVTLPAGSYSPDVYRDFTLDFLRRHKDGPFFFYYATHLVHKPTLKTPETQPDTKDAEKLYDDNIRYMDKEVGTLVAELEKLGIRQNTLIVFAGDNGTAAGYPSPVRGRIVNGAKGSLLEGGSRVPFIASWPGVTPAGKVVEDIVDFSDPYATFAEVAGAKLSDKLKIDGVSFAPQLRGETGKPRPWAFVQLGARWYVREPGFKLNEKAELFDMSDAPFVEKLVAVDADTEQSKAARKRLTASLAELNPAGGKTDEGAGAIAGRRRPGAAPAAGAGPAEGGPWKSGDAVAGPASPDVAGKPFEITAEVDVTGTHGVIIAHGGAARGYAVYLKEGKLAFSIRAGGTPTTITAKELLGAGHFVIRATVAKDGALALLVNGKEVAGGKVDGLINQQPRAGLSIGQAGASLVADYESPGTFEGKVSEVRVKVRK